MKTVWRILLLAGLLNLLAGKEVLAETSLQSRIDAIPEGGTLHIQKGNYHERIILKKTINIIAEKGTMFKDCSTKPVITITGKNVKLKGVRIEGCYRKSREPMIYISGKNHQIVGVKIDSERTAVKLDHAEYTIVKNLIITRKDEERGIDLWQSNFNIFTGIEMKHVQDGFYMENSHFNTFTRNKIRDSRYGLHVMFSDHITISNNKSQSNYTGAMIMGTNNSVIEKIN